MIWNNPQVSFIWFDCSSFVKTCIELIQFWRRWWEVWLLWLEGLPDLCDSTKDLITRVQKALLKTW